MITLGVDLAAEPTNTAACLVDWATGRVVVRSRVTDAVIVDLAREASVVGLDVPLGWPDHFVRAVTRHHAGEPWISSNAGSIAGRDPLRFRVTDIHLRAAGHRPLSVSTELIGVVALRAAHLQQRLADAGLAVDRSGATGNVVEVYPAAALRTWGLPSRGYKGASNEAVRAELVAQIVSACGPSGATVSDALLGATDHVVDAFVCAVIAAASRLGMTELPSETHQAVAEAEGWIDVPTRPLSQIVVAAASSNAG